MSTPIPLPGRLFLRTWMLLALLPFLAFASAPVQWQWLNPKPTGNHWVHVFAETARRGIAVAENGEVARTEDAGASWNIIGSGNPGMLISAASTLDGLHLLGSGVGGRIWKSDDAGKEWRAGTLGLRTYFGICHIGPGISLAAGEGSSILRTRDGGESWRSVHEDSLGKDLLAIHCGENGLAVAVGSDGAMLKSQDSGTSWIGLPSATRMALAAVLFTDSLQGYAAGSGGVFLKTQDGGLHWTSRILDSNSALLRGMHVNGSELMICGSNGEIWQSPDQGSTWARRATGSAHFLASMARFGAESHVAVGNQGVILQSADGGGAWTNRRLGPENVIIGMTTLSPASWLAFGIDGLVLRTTDAGLTWSESPAQQGHDWLAGAFWKDRKGLLAGYDGALMRTEDGGESWEPLTSGMPHARFDGVAWADSLTAVVVGDSGAFLRSTDGARSFSPVSAPGWNRQTLSAVRFLSPDVGIVVGYQGLILRTGNGGRSWESIASPTRRDLFAMSFSNGSHGVAVGNGDTVLFTHDGGNTWKAFSTGSPDDYLYGVALLGADTAIAVGEWLHYGITRMTTDGGSTWREIPNATHQVLNGIVPVQPGRVVALGAGGAVLSAVVGGGRPDLSIHRDAGFGNPHFRAMRRPGSPRVQFAFTLPAAGTIQIAAFSMTGKWKGTVFSGNLPKGSHRVAGASDGSKGIFRLTWTGPEKQARIWYAR